MICEINGVDQVEQLNIIERHISQPLQSIDESVNEDPSSPPAPSPPPPFSAVGHRAISCETLSQPGSPVTPARKNNRKRPYSSTLDAQSEYVIITPDKRTPVKPDIDSILRSLTRRSPRDHPSTMSIVPLSQQAESLRRKAKRSLMTPSRPPFHQSPARPHSEARLFTPQVHNDETLAKQQRRHNSDSASLTSRKLTLNDASPRHAENRLLNVSVSMSQSNSLPSTPLLPIQSHDSLVVEGPSAPQSSPASPSHHPSSRRRTSTRSQKVLFPSTSN